MSSFDAYHHPASPVINFDEAENNELADDIVIIVDRLSHDRTTAERGLFTLSAFSPDRTAAQRALFTLIAIRGFDVLVTGQFTEMVRAQTLRLICDPVTLEFHLAGLRLHPEVIAELVRLSDVVRMLEQGVLETRVQYDEAYMLLAEIEVAVDHLGFLYDDEDFYHISLLQHAAWFGLICASPGQNWFNPFQYFRHTNGNTPHFL